MTITITVLAQPYVNKHTQHRSPLFTFIVPLSLANVYLITNITKVILGIRPFLCVFKLETGKICYICHKVEKCTPSLVLDELTG